MNPIDIFLSHSSADAKIAQALIDLLRAAFRLEPEKIRCTSVPGYKLKVGADTETELRREVGQARVFIGLLSEISLDSAYVLFELGARWGSIQNYGQVYNAYGSASGKNKIFPVLAAGASGSMLRDPLKQYNALNCEKAADLHQLIGDIGDEISQKPGNPAAYQDKIDNLIQVSRQLKAKRARDAKLKTSKEVAAPVQTKTPTSKRGSAIAGSKNKAASNKARVSRVQKP